MKSSSTKPDESKVDKSATATAHFIALSAITANDSSNPNEKENMIRFALDSGATDHMVNDDSVLVDCVNIDNDASIKCAKKQSSLSARKRGTLFTRNANGVGLKFNNVIFSPDLAVNLISIRRLNEKGFLAIVRNATITVTNSEGMVILQGTLDAERLYIVNLQINNDDSSPIALVTSSDNLLWHRRFGHASPEYLRRLFANQPELPDLRFDNLDMAKCGTCCKAKQSKHPYCSKRHRATRPLEIVHTDVIGPISPSLNDEEYIVSFLDDYTYYCVLFVIRRRSDLVDQFIQYEGLATAKFNIRIENVRCDNTLEYIAGRFKEFCDARGIRLQHSEPYEHEHNGRIERYNRSVMEKTRALLYEANLPDRFWSYAAYAACYLLNRLPTAALDYSTPYKKWNDRKANLKNLRVFGCVAREMVPYEKQTKLEPKSKDTILVGFTDTGYILFDVRNEKISTSSNVLFHEELNIADIGAIELIEEIVDQNHEAPPEFAALVAIDEHHILSYDEAINTDEVDQWRAAIERELAATSRNGVWEVVDEANGNIIDMIWACKKKKPDGSIIYRARLCARGCLDRNEYSLAQTHAPVVKLATLRGILVIGCINDWSIKHTDVSNAFLFGDFDPNTIIFSKPPQGTGDEHSGKFYRILRPIYGLKTSAKDWFDKLRKTLLSLGFVQCKSDPCVFYYKRKKKRCIIAIYVDDFVITGEDD